MEISKFTNWFKEYGWRHLVGLIFVTFAIYPILFVLTNSFADFANLTNSKLIPNSLTLKHYKLLSGDPLVPYFQWLYNTYKVAFLAAFDPINTSFSPVIFQPALIPTAVLLLVEDIVAIACLPCL